MFACARILVRGKSSEKVKVFIWIIIKMRLKGFNMKYNKVRYINRNLYFPKYLDTSFIMPSFSSTYFI